LFRKIPDISIVAQLKSGECRILGGEMAGWGDGGKRRKGVKAKGRHGDGRKGERVNEGYNRFKRIVN